MKKFKGKINDSLEVKRFYFDGVLRHPCPKCNSIMTRDFSSDYLSYPQVGVTEDCGLYCNDCNREYIFPMTVKSIEINIEYDETKIV